MSLELDFHFLIKCLFIQDIFKLASAELRNWTSLLIKKQPKQYFSTTKEKKDI